MAGEPKALAIGVLLEGKPVPPFWPGRIALARGLPVLAEELQCSADVERRSRAERRLEELWRDLEPDELATPDFGTLHLALGCRDAASLLGVEIPAHPKVDDRPLYRFHERAALVRPRVYAPLLNDAPARVFHTCEPVHPLAEDDAVRETRALVRKLLGVEHPVWALGRPAPGRSKMAALFFRAVLERWPEKRQVFAWGGSGTSGQHERTVFGVTGELDLEGRVLPVDGIADKVRGFFRHHPDGRLFVPESQWRQAREVADSLDDRQQFPDWHRAKRTWRLQPLRSALELLLRLGISTEACPETVLFEKLHKSSERVTFWSGLSFNTLETVAPSYVRVRRANDESSENPYEHSLLEGLHEAWLSGHARLAFIEGGPGSGKSIALQRLAALLPCEYLALGPALGVTARALVQHELDVARALAHLRKSLEPDECRELVRLARTPLLSGSMWLLVDGLDEVTPDERRRIRTLVDGWPGPVVLGARPLPNEAPGPYYLRLAPLEHAQCEKLFQLLGKPGHWRVLTEGHKKEEGIPDRRKAMLADLCSTPLGLSLLAEFPEEQLGPSLNVQKILRGGVHTLLKRAREAGRISEDVERTVTREGLPILGAAAWAMIQRESAQLEPEDLERMQGERTVVNAVHAVLDNSDLVQPVGTLSHQFSHKSLAELCAALHLKSQSEAERELLKSLGGPGMEAVAFHFGALVAPERRRAFLHALANNPHRPMSSLALATRLLAANGPEPALAEAALEVLVRRVRLASRLAPVSHEVSRLPGGLHEETEMWRALERWADELRPRVAKLLAASPPEVARLLDGTLPPLSAAPEQKEVHAACDFAEALALALGLERDLPARVLVRFREGQELLQSRADGPWIQELEALFEMPADVGRTVPAITAARVWALRAAPEQKLKRLDLLSMFPLNVVQPLVETVCTHGTPDQRREALIRAALQHLELFGDRGSDSLDARLFRRYARMPREKLLRRWKLLWDRGLLGQLRGFFFTFAPELDRLYETFLDDEYGPVRWQALHAHSRFDAPFYTARLRDGFPAVRTETLLCLKQLGDDCLDARQLEESLRSPDDNERWVAFRMLLSKKKELPLQELLAALRERNPPPPEPSSPRRSSRRRLEPSWLRALQNHGHEARAELFAHTFKAAQGHEEVWPALIALVDKSLRATLESLEHRGTSTRDFNRAMLAHGSPRQRLFAAELLHWKHPDALAAHVGDPDPDIALFARSAGMRLRNEEQQAARRKDLDDEARRAKAQPTALKNRPQLGPEQLSGFASFEALWDALPGYQLPHLPFKPARAPRWPFEPDSETPRDSMPLLLFYWYDQLTQRLLQLYEPRHQTQLLDGLRDTELAPHAACVLREYLPIPELTPLALDLDGALVDFASLTVARTPQGMEVARKLRAELLSGRLDALFSDSVPNGVLRLRRRGGWLLSPSHHLVKLDGPRGLLPLVELGTPEWLRSEALETIRTQWDKLARLAPAQPEVLEWARAHEGADDVETRRVALDLLALVGTHEDAARWRLALFRDDTPEPLLAAALRIVGRFPGEPDLDRFRALLSRSPQVGSQAAVVLAKAANASRVEELVRLLESPPASLEDARASTVPWRRAIAEAVLQSGDGEQTKRTVKRLGHDDLPQKAALQHLRLPEQVLFIAAGWRPPDSPDANARQHDEATLEHLREVIPRVGEAPAHRVLIEAAFWEPRAPAPAEHPIRSCASKLLERVDERDVELLVEALRRRPADALALRWLSTTGQGEEALATAWTERAHPWWVP